ncbi:MAG TPA: AI-2E family transporter [Streptosporangiaceae bacterium]|jgi:predicted PurR-regulated permease PerM
MIVDQDDPGAQQLTAVADGTREPSAAPPPDVAPAGNGDGAGAATSPRTMFRWGVYVSLGVLAVALVVISVYNTRGILIEVLIALFIAVSLDPAVRRLNRWGVRRGWAVVVILLITTGIVAGFLVSVIPSMVHQFQVLIHDFPGYVKTLQERSPSFRRISDRYHLTTKIEDLLASLPGRVSTGAITVTRRLFGALFSTLTVVVLTIYFMADLPRLRQSVARLFPKAHRAEVAKITDVMVDKVGDYMIGNLAISLFAGLATFVTFTALGLPFAVPVGFAVGVFDLIPMIGATLGAIVCVGVSLLTSNIWPETVVVILFFVGYQQVENYLIAPRVQKKAVSLSAAAVLLAGLIGATILGLIGALMAIPVAAALKVIFAERLAIRDAADPHPDPAPGPSPEPDRDPEPALSEDS